MSCVEGNAANPPLTASLPLEFPSHNCDRNSSLPDVDSLSVGIASIGVGGDSASGGIDEQAIGFAQTRVSVA